MTEPTHNSGPGRRAAERAKPTVPPMRDVPETPAVPAMPGGVVPGGGSPVRPDTVASGGGGRPDTTSGGVESHAAAEAAGTETGVAPRTAEPQAVTGTDDPGTTPAAERVHLKRTRISGLWVGITVAAVVLLLLLVFIVQNNTYVTIYFFGWGGQFPLGVALLLAAICGVLLVAIPGYGRILQLRRSFHRATRAQ